jgi:hypothetical protein
MRYFVLISVVIIGLMSCEKVIQINVGNIESKLVIEAVYNASEERVDVKLSMTKDVFGAGVNPIVTGATIEIIDDAGNISLLTDQGDGSYLLTGYAPVFTSSYNMRVTVDGEIYEASTFLPNVVELDSLSQIFVEASLFGEAGYVVFMNFTDPVGPNFYRAVRTLNGERLARLGEQFIFDDTFSEGNVQTVPFFSTRHVPGDSLAVEFRSYSKESYKYYTELFALAGDGGQSAAPANPTTNWSNGAIGHFAAWGSDTKYIVIVE